MTTHHIHSGAVSLIIDITEGVPEVLYWGAAIPAFDANGPMVAALRDATVEGVPHGLSDVSPRQGIWRENSRGYLGRPALDGHRGGLDWSPLFRVTGVDATDSSIRLEAADDHAGLSATVTFTMQPGGVVVIDHSLTNRGDADYTLNELTTWLPLPDRASAVLDFTGRWTKERQPQRHEIRVGEWVRESREGRSG
ncbi:MAG: glycoside hydrolase family 36 N-terminal domain-containing protein, partial [Microbacteriaceae bacterium]